MSTVAFDAIVTCENYPHPQSATQRVPVLPDMMVAEFLAKCEQVFNISGQTQSPIHADLFFVRGALPEPFVDDAQTTPMIRSQEDKYRVRYSLKTTLLVIANEVVNKDVHRIERQQPMMLPLFEEVNPGTLWYNFLKSGSGKGPQGGDIPNYGQTGTIRAYLQNRSTLQRRDLVENTAAWQIGLTPQDDLVVCPRVTVPLTSIAGEIPMVVDLSESWGQVLGRIMHAAPNVTADFKALSPNGALRVRGRWVGAEQSVAESLVPGDSVWVHPIVGCVFMALADGKLNTFFARLPADVAVSDLIPGIKKQMETHLNLRWPDGSAMCLVSCVPTAFPNDLVAGRLGMNPAQCLKDIGVKNGWAVFFLLEERQLPNIVEIQETEIGVSDRPVGASKMGTLPGSLS